MNVDAVLDANVLLYAASKDPADRAKAEAGLRLLGTVNFGMSMQVVQEFFHNARNKARLAIDVGHCDRMVTALLQRPLVITDMALFEEARRLCRRHQLSYWDAAVLAATRRLGAPILYSEDLSDGQNYDGVKVVNPFRGLD
ncbi:MAG: PIN domain-containing protein [Verrucomicrobia bacterium]|nr:PIN domain-containing protein [Verrucomicrobiota bacterium]